MYCQSGKRSSFSNFTSEANLCLQFSIRLRAKSTYNEETFSRKRLLECSSIFNTQCFFNAGCTQQFLICHTDQRINTFTSQTASLCLCGKAMLNIVIHVLCNNSNIGVIINRVTGKRNDSVPSSSSSKGAVQNEFQITVSYTAQPVPSPTLEDFNAQLDKAMVETDPVLTTVLL